MVNDSPEDWRESGRINIEEFSDLLVDKVYPISTEVEKIDRKLKAHARADEPDVEEMREILNETTEMLIEASHDLLDLAKQAKSKRTGGPMRMLEGKEPLNYSTRDGGAKHDAYYGAIANDLVYERSIKWPLRLTPDDGWDKETATPIRGEELELVSAEGTKKYSMRVGDRQVHVVIDERGMGPQMSYDSILSNLADEVRYSVQSMTIKVSRDDTHKAMEEIRDNYGEIMGVGSKGTTKTITFTIPEMREEEQ